jgi:hypothetical protein
VRMPNTLSIASLTHCGRSSSSMCLVQVGGARDRRRHVARAQLSFRMTSVGATHSSTPTKPRHRRVQS